MLSYRELLVFCLFLMLLTVFHVCQMEKITYISLERPVVLSYNKKYVPFYNITARRYTREDPKYYVSGHVTTLVPLDDKITVDFYFYKFSSNTYQRTFFELSFKFCDLLNKDAFIGSVMKQGTFKRSCPLPAGEHHVENCSMPVENIPTSLPFRKGRIFCNVTYYTGENMGKGYIDMEVKEKVVGRKNNN